MNILNETHTPRLINFSANAPSLLDQLDRVVSVSMLSRAAVVTAIFLEHAENQPAEYQSGAVSKLSASVLGNVSVESIESVAAALGAATLLTVAKFGPATPSERIKKALTVLSDRYQCDW